MCLCPTLQPTPQPLKHIPLLQLHTLWPKIQYVQNQPGMDQTNTTAQILVQNFFVEVLFPSASSNQQKRSHFEQWALIGPSQFWDEGNIIQSEQCQTQSSQGFLSCGSLGWFPGQFRTQLPICSDARTQLTFQSVLFSLTNINV